MIKKLFTFLCLCTLCIGSAWGAVTPLTLPKTWQTSDGKSAYTEALGCTLSGIGSDYSAAPKLKFDDQGDYMIIQLADDPKEISFNIKGNSVSGTYSFKVQESDNGSTYTDALNITSVTGSSANKTASLKSSTKYIKLVYTTKASGNMGVGGISITKAESTNPKYNITTASKPTSAGNVTANPTTQEAEKQVTLTAAPNEAYNFTSWSITKTEDGTETGITVDGEGKFTMPAYAVTATANFTAKAIYDITYYVNGTQETVSNVYAGTIISSKLPVPSSGVSGYVFKGWIASPIEGAVQTAPSYYDTTQGISGNITLYAVFALETKENVAFSKYEQVTTAPADWSGKYLLSTGEITFTGQSGSNTYGAYAEIEPGTTEQTLYEVEVAKTTNGYSMYHDGKYLGLTSNSNALHFSTDFKATDYEWTFDTETGAGHGIISVKYSNCALKYNSGSPRFACYTSAQTYVYMYKRIETGTITYSDYCTTINIEAGNVTFEVGEGATFKKNDTFTAQETTVKPGTYTNLPSASKPLYKFEGWYLSTDVNQEVVSSITVADGDDLTYVAKWQGLSISNIEDVTAAGDYKVEGTVVATTDYGFVVGDATGFAYVNTGNLTLHGKVVGDKVTVLGSVSESAGVLIFKSNLEISEAVSSTYDSSVEPTTIDAAALVALLEEKQTQYVEYVGDLSYSGSYYNIAVKGTNDAYGRIYSATTEEIATLTGILGEKSSAEVKVKGYYVGVGNNKYANTILGTIEAYTIPTHNLTVHIDGEGCNVNVQINSVNQEGVNGVYTIKDGEIVSLVQKKAEHFNFVEWTSKDITISDDEKAVSSLTFIVTKDITVNASFEEDAYKTITWSVLGKESTAKYYEGSKLTLPTEPNPEELGLVDGYVFMGWSANQVVASDGTGFTPVVAGSEVAEDKTYYAVFAYRTGEAGSEETAALTSDDIQKSDYQSGYQTSITITGEDGYSWVFNGSMHGQTSKVGNTYLQLGQKSGLGHTPTFSNNIKKIVINASGASGRYLQLYDGDEKLGDAQETGSSQKDYTFNITGEYKQLNFANHDGSGGYSTSNNAINIYSIEVTYGSPGNYEYSGYTTGAINISTYGWATVCLPFKATISDNATAYYVTGTEGNALTKSDATVIPAGEGVLLKSNNGGEATVTFTLSTETADAATGNMMKGALTETTFNKTGYTYYILANGSNGLGFYYQGADNTTGAVATCPAGKAVLAVPTTSGAKAFFSLDDEPSGIEDVQSSRLNVQGSVYNLNGVRVNGNYKGIVIMNGKKFMNK